MKIGPHQLANNVFVAPMAGVTDRPFRQLCKALGAGYAVSEMAASNPRLWASEKTARRTNHEGEMEPKAVQIAGADPQMLAECARHNVERGAQIIDINMGCPVKKVCNSWCGSALLQDEPLVSRILEAVVKAVDVPVTLKFRTGWDRQHRNALAVARMAEDSGIAMLTLHGRTRADGYSGQAEYETIAEVKSRVSIPVVANGDIDSPAKAAEVLGTTGELLPPPEVEEVRVLMLEHLRAHYAFYGDYLGVRTARKHIGWYVRGLAGGESFRRSMNALEDCEAQLAAVDGYFRALADQGKRLQYCLSAEPLAA